jgi:CubicO group peptidase (beta-lactamase class C family)
MRLAGSLIALFLLNPVASVAADATNDPLTETIRQDLAVRCADRRFSGVVLVVRGAATLASIACGSANVLSKTLNTLETRYRFGSLGKMFTAVAIAQLEQAGKIHFDDPLGKYLTDYPNKAIAGVTIDQLLTHTGGTGDIFGPEFLSARTRLRELRDYVHEFGDRGPEFPPGSRHQYSNYGYILLGRVIEVVSGRSYDEYVREHIFEPSGMSSTGNRPEDEHVTLLAVPYTRAAAGAPLESAEPTLPYRGTSAGGGYTTAGDLLKFAQALMSNRLLDAANTQRILTGKVETPRPGMKYGYGFEDATLPDGRRRVGHGGGAPGINATMSIFPAGGEVAIVLANVDPPAAMDVDRFLSRRLASD